MQAWGSPTLASNGTAPATVKAGLPRLGEVGAAPHAWENLTLASSSSASQLFYKEEDACTVPACITLVKLA